MKADEWYRAHADLLDRADAACSSRAAHSPFTESPSGRLHPPDARARGGQWFEQVRGSQFPDTGPPDADRFVGAESSPYTLEPLGISYVRPTADQAAGAAEAAWPCLLGTTADQRIGICLEALHRLSGALFENAFATMHTAGQAFMMAFAGSGANSLDRGLEAVVFAHRAMAQVPETAVFERDFGHRRVRLEKSYRIRGRGLAIVITCGSYPLWNAYPAIFANLATGNPVIVKPHPTTILPVALAVQIIRGTLTDAGLDPDLVVLAPDTPGSPITDALVDHPATRIVDFTGSPGYGARLEARTDRLVYTETAGCNAVVLEGADDLDAALDAVARGLMTFSGQMCTAPQNIFIPPTVDTPAGPVGYGQVRDRLVARVDELSADPKLAPALCGALHSPNTAEDMARLAGGARCDGSQRLLREGTPYTDATFPHARTRTPTLIEEPVDGSGHKGERFGPVAFVIPCPDRDAALAAATSEADEHGAIASYAYTRDPGFADRIESAFWSAGASVGINLIGQQPINYTAGYSDYHVTGLNPAGNASLTDIAFVADRFRIVQSKREVRTDAGPT